MRRLRYSTLRNKIKDGLADVDCFIGIRYRHEQVAMVRFWNEKKGKWGKRIAVWITELPGKEIL